MRVRVRVRVRVCVDLQLHPHPEEEPQDPPQGPRHVLGLYLASPGDYAPGTFQSTRMLVCVHATSSHVQAALAREPKLVEGGFGRRRGPHPSPRRRWCEPLLCCWVGRLLRESARRLLLRLVLLFFPSRAGAGSFSPWREEKQILEYV